MSRSRRLSALVWLVITAGACGPDAATGPAAPAETPDFRSAGSIGSRYNLASGWAQVDAFGLSHTYSFVAYALPGGPGQGSWGWVGEHPDGRWEASGEVLCLLVVGNVAQVSGRVDFTNAYWIQPPLNYATWTVVDMGNGSGSPPDQGSLLNITTEAQAMAHCAANSFAFTPPVTRGEILVRAAR